MKKPALTLVVSCYQTATSGLLALLPAGAVLYLWLFPPLGLTFDDHRFHMLAIGSASAVGGVLAYVAFRCYQDGGEKLTRFLALGFLGFTVSYLLHGLLTPVAHDMPALFLLPGPTSRLVMSSFVLLGVACHGQPPDPVETRLSPKRWLPWLLLQLAVLHLTLWVAVNAPISPQTFRLWVESAAAIASLSVLVTLAVRRARGPMLWYHAVAVVWLAISSGAFLLASPWTHMWWLAHCISVGGFLLLGHGLAQAYQSSGNFSGLYSAPRAHADLAEMKRAQDLLHQAILAADQANQGKSRFLAAASHDLRQPVQALMLFSALLEGCPLDDRTRSVVRNLSNGVQALKSLLDGLLDISRLDAGVIEPHLVDVDLQSLLTPLTEEYSLLAERKGLELLVATAQVWVHTDPALVERILRNLIENAIKYTQCGRVTVECSRHWGRVRIEVRDTGIGIPEDQRNAVFDEFHQLDNPERDRSKGLGLGLSIVRRLAELLGHPLELSSRMGEGSCFTLSLPLGASAGTPLNQVPALPDHGGLVLVIDDDEAVLTGLGMILEQWGWQVVAGESPEEALSLLPAERIPDVVISDYRLRDGLTGIAVLRQLHLMFGTGCRGILLTGDTAPEPIAEARRGNFPVLHKPVAAEALHNALTMP